MAHKRQKQLEALIEKMVWVIKSLHARHGFPFGESKLNRLQVMVMFFIFRKKDGTNAKELAKFLNVTSGAVTQFIDVLVEKKLLQREEDSTDRRVTKILLTTGARQKFAAFKKTYYKSVSPAFDGLSDEEVGVFIRLLGKIKTV